MTVIDMDSHFEPPMFTADEHPLREFLDRLPDMADLVMQNLAGDLWFATPQDERERLEPALPLLQLLRGEESELRAMMTAVDRPAAADDLQARLEWMDRVGIDVAMVNPGGAYSAAVATPEQYLKEPGERHRAITVCNDYLADWVAGHTARLAPVTLVDYDDLDWSVGELERMRARGSRAVFLWATPFEGRSPAHPANDRFWHALSGLGMVGILHIGATPARFDGGWGDAGWTAPGGTGAAGFLRFANSQRTQAAQTFLSALIFGGTFERAPAATVVLAELWASWLPWFVSRLEMLADAGGALGPYGLPLAPQDYARRNVKATPLPGLQDDGAGAFAAVPDMLVFSSDFPHSEGNAEPIAVYGSVLDELPGDVRSKFLGETMAECFARTGDPLVR